MEIATINPATEETIGRYQTDSGDAAARAVGLAFEAQRAWRSLSFNFRGQKLLNLKKLLEENQEELALLMTQEMGKPISESIAEIKKSAGLCEYAAKNAERFLSRQEIQTAASKSYVTFAPLGPILGIMPWNFPLWQVVRFALPTLMAGNTVLIKHAENTMGTALFVAKLFDRAGMGGGVYQNLILTVEQTGELIANPQIRGVSLTGSVRAGREVGARAGRALKKAVLELGGSDPYVVFRDADLSKAVEQCVIGRMINSGQSCIAAKRFIVVSSVYDKFRDLLLEKITSLKWGDPLSPETQIGPMARRDLRDSLHSQVQRSIEQGAECLMGGKIPTQKGFFYPPTVLGEVVPGIPVFDEEVFGPVVVLVKARDEEDAIRLANTSDFGLGAAVFTSNAERGEQVVRDYLECGMGFVNDFVRSTPELPFGGVKSSGLGRELGPQGFAEFVNVKTTWVK